MSHASNIGSNLSETSVRVLATGTQAIFRKGLVFILEEAPDITVCAEASDGPESVALARELLPDIVLMDINMPSKEGLSATRVVAAINPTVKVIALTAAASDSSFFEAIRSGASAYLLKTAAAGELVDAIKMVFNGGTVISPALTSRLVAEFRRLEQAASPETLQALGAGLTDREIQVLTRLADGMSNREIAHSLQVSERTVKNYVSNILAKLQLDNRVQAALFAYRAGLIP